MEIVTQTRLYNFLFCDSILILAWATVFSSLPSTAGRAHVLVLLSGLSFLLGMACAALGHRASAFLKVHYDTDSYLETFLPKELRLTTHVVALQRDGSYVCRSPDFAGQIVELPLWERGVLVSGHFLVIFPIALVIASLFLIAISLNTIWLAWLIIALAVAGSTAVLANDSVFGVPLRAIGRKILQRIKSE